MSLPRAYVANHKFYDKRGRLTPNVTWSESDSPHSENFAPAPWLPVQRWDEDLDVGEWIVVSSGKVVALDGGGFLVPAGLRKKFNVASGTTVLTYTQNDVDAKVVDLVTGQLLTATVSYTEAQVTAALRERGVIKPSESAFQFISKPIGTAHYNYYKAAGTDLWDPTKLFWHNWRPQQLVAVHCDFVETVPLVPGTVATETMANDNTGGADNLLELVFAGTASRVKGWFNSTQIHEVERFASEVAADDNVVCYLTTNPFLATVTDDSEITASVAGLVKKVGSISSISAAGDYFVDYEVGCLFLYEAGGNAIPSPFSTSATLGYYHYNAVPASVTTYACAVGNLEYGDFVTVDADSNFVKATLDISAAEGKDGSGNIYSADPDYSSASDAAISLQLEQAFAGYLGGIVGQVIGTIEYPRDNLDRVRTPFASGLNATYKAPGSATGGRSDQLTYAHGADRMVLINIILR